MHCRPLGRSWLKGEALSKLSEQLGELGEEGAMGRKGRGEGGGGINYILGIITWFRSNQTVCLLLPH